MSMANFTAAHRAALSLLSDEIVAVRRGVETAAADLPGPGGAAARLMVERPGKMVRPLLVGLVHRSLGGAGGRACSEAAALVEVIHLSTLLHDDVIDEAAMRRGAPSAAFAVGNAAAVLGGDALVVRAITAANRLGGATLERTLFALHRLVTGELVQLRDRGDTTITAARAREVATLKTGALMRLCAELGALTAGRPLDEAVRLGEVFEGLGVAFQVVDDLLDLTGDEATVGKAVGKDVTQGTLSLPVALALDSAALHRKALGRAFCDRAAIIGAPRTRGEDSAATAGSGATIGAPRTQREARSSEARMGRVVQHALARTDAVARSLQVVEAELGPVTHAIAALPPSVARDTLQSVCAAMGLRGS